MNNDKTEKRHGSPTFYAMLDEMAKIHDVKSHDYANNDNPYGNYIFAGYVASLFAHSPLDMGFASRIAEKIYRISVLEGGRKTPKNETIDDTERDIPTICTLWMAARKDSRKPKTNPMDELMNELSEETIAEADQIINQAMDADADARTVRIRSRKAAEAILVEYGFLNEQDLRELECLFRRNVADLDAARSQNEVNKTK